MPAFLLEERRKVSFHHLRQVGILQLVEWQGDVVNGAKDDERPLVRGPEVDFFFLAEGE